MEVAADSAVPTAAGPAIAAGLAHESREAGRLTAEEEEQLLAMLEGSDEEQEGGEVADDAHPANGGEGEEALEEAPKEGSWEGAGAVGAAAGQEWGGSMPAGEDAAAPPPPAELQPSLLLAPLPGSDSQGSPPIEEEAGQPGTASQPGGPPPLEPSLALAPLPGTATQAAACFEPSLELAPLPGPQHSAEAGPAAAQVAGSPEQA